MKAISAHRQIQFALRVGNAHRVPSRRRNISLGYSKGGHVYSYELGANWSHIFIWALRARKWRAVGETGERAVFCTFRREITPPRAIENTTANRRRWRARNVKTAVHRRRVTAKWRKTGYSQSPFGVTSVRNYGPPLFAVYVHEKQTRWSRKFEGHDSRSSHDNGPIMRLIVVGCIFIDKIPKTKTAVNTTYIRMATARSETTMVLSVYGP